MAEKRQKSDEAGAEGVLAALPASRPSRMGRRAREDGPAKPATARSKPKSASAAKPKPKAAAKPKPTASAKPKPAPVAALPGPAEPEKPKRPRAVRAGSPPLKDKANQANERREPVAADRSPSGPELAATVVQAAGELAQIGLTVGGQILKRAVGKLPRR